jgi:signal transduction histidine kinase
MSQSRSVEKSLVQLARRLAERRPTILETMRARVMGDPENHTAVTLSKQAFIDHLPQLLASLEARLTTPEPERVQDRRERAPAEQHGEHRWGEGYSLVQTMDEWRHLDQGLWDELRHWAEENASVSVEAVLSASAAVAAFIEEGMHSCARRYSQLQRVDAARRASELQTAYEEVTTLERERVGAWRQALHDLRGRVGAISDASVIAQHPNASLDVQQRSQEALSRGLVGLREMLNELTDLARLEARVESLHVTTFDVSKLLHELGTSLQPTAITRGLLLDTEGPDPFEVQGDPVKVQRIAQNLLQNALKYTDDGRVSLRWFADASQPRLRWILCVEDTGTGLNPTQAPGQHAQESPSAATPTGHEGLGLTIVHRLCDLLQARLQIESAPKRGTIIRVIFPSSY